MNDIRTWRNADAEPREQLVLSIPFCFTYYQKLVLRQAALAAGFPRVKFCLQNHAILLDYCYTNKMAGQRELLLVVSVGATYTDASLYSFSGKQIECVALQGRRVGGSDVTRAILEAVKTKLGTSGIEAVEEKELYAECEIAKVALVDKVASISGHALRNESASILTDAVKIPFRDSVVSLDWDEMTEAISSIVHDICAVVSDCLQEHSTDQVAKVLTYGGSVFCLAEFLKLNFGGRVPIIPTQLSSLLAGSYAFAKPSQARIKMSAVNQRFYHYGVQTADN
ncbi:hypothetical protein HDU91_004195, partial [Kappamyces sp. JEL0680]